MKKSPMVSITKINALFVYLENRRINTRQFLLMEGFDPSILDNPDNKISIEEMYHLIHKAAESTNDPYIGLHMGEMFTGLANIVGSVMINCKNIGEAYRTCLKYQRIFDETKNSELIVTHNIATLTFSLVIDYYDQDRILSEFQGVAAYITLEQLTGKQVHLNEIHFRHKKPQDISEYQRIFKCPIRFGADVNAIVFNSHYLQLPLKQPNPQLYTLFKEHAQHMLQQLESNELFSNKVQKIIISSMNTKFPSIKQVAQKMAMSVRKLQMKLKEEGTSFSNIIDKTREGLAIQYLKDKNITINEATFLLGFSEPSVFHRSFKRWTGFAPSEFRKNCI